MEGQDVSGNYRRATWLRYGLSLMFLALTLIRILDNGLFAFGWVADLLIAATFLVMQTRGEGEPFRNYLERPRSVLGLCLFLGGVAFTISFDVRHFLGK